MSQYEHIYKDRANRIPGTIKKVIRDENWLESLEITSEEDTPFHYLFCVYIEYIENAGDFSCGMCRDYIYRQWQQMKQHL